MNVVQTVTQVRYAVAEARKQGARVGLVPTMGALHQGHAALIAAAAAECDFVVVSIFVNPLQFGPHEDYDKYPRQLSNDMALCKQQGASLIFNPSVSDMYPQKPLTHIDVDELTNGLCGASRPGHFRGVATVVAKLFNIVLPDKAYFGQKDAQQAAVLQQMVRDLNFPLELVIVPTVREADGLAISSRNAYLSAEERVGALVLYRALQQVVAAVETGERSVAKLHGQLCQMIASEPLARLDYAEIVDASTLKPVKYVTGRVLVAIAVYIGQTRLIDNVVIEAGG